MSKEMETFNEFAKEYDKTVDEINELTAKLQEKKREIKANWKKYKELWFAIPENERPDTKD